MIDLNVSILGADDLRSYLSGLTDQVPYATAVAINRTLDDAQSAIRVHEHATFAQRAPDFIDRTIYIGNADRAKKDKLIGTVRIDPNRDFLAKFEDGGTKTPTGSAKSLAVPIIRASSPGIIIRRGDQLSVKNLLAAIDAANAGRAKNKGSRARLKKLAGIDINGKRVFLLHARNGSTLIVERTGTGSSGSLAGSRVLWAFRPSVPIKASLEFDQIAYDTAVANWETNAQDALNLAIETSR